MEAARRAPHDSQWYYSFEEDEGLGPVIDIVNVPTAEAVTVTIETEASAATSAAMDGGLYGTLIRAVYAHADRVPQAPAAALLADEDRLFRVAAEARRYARAQAPWLGVGVPPRGLQGPPLPEG